MREAAIPVGCSLNRRNASEHLGKGKKICGICVKD